MITQFKIYENFLTSFFPKRKDEPQIGDYVLSEIGNYDIPEVIDFIKDNIGQFIILWKEGTSAPYVVKYENIPEEYVVEFQHLTYRKEKFKRVENIWRFKREEIKYFGTKEEMEMILQANKYNL